MIRDGEAIFMKYFGIYDDEVRARTTVQIKAVKTTLKLFWIGHGRARDSWSAYDHESAIMLFVTYTFGFDF